MRKTKIVCTIGPATESEEALERLVEAGMDVARLNFSHGSHEEHKTKLDRVRAVSMKKGRPVAVLMDLCGPKIRLGEIQGGGFPLESGADLVIKSGNFVGTKDAVSTTYESLTHDLEEGDRVLVDDGNIELIVREKKSDRVVCKVIHGGYLKQKKGINLPGAKISSPSVTEKDLRDLQWGIENNVDYVALSFVRSPDDVRKVRGILHKADCHARVIAKIEKPEALEHIDEIIECADGIMVARGDLGIEMNPEDVPPAQKDLIRKANQKDRTVITATQMLESMTHNPRPTRAEVSDVANAIFDGSDAVMLSGETAVGEFPINSVLMMSTIARKAEDYNEKQGTVFHSEISRVYSTGDAVCHAAAEAARDVAAPLIVVYSSSGVTALLMSKYHPRVPVIGLSHDQGTVARMCLFRGVIPVLTPRYEDEAQAVKDMERIATSLGLAQRGDSVVAVTGSKLGMAGGTNSVRVHRIEVPMKTRSFRREDSEVETYEAGEICLYFKPGQCFHCGVCVGRCPLGVFETESGKVVVRGDRLESCLLDMTCVENCPVNAIRIERG